MKIKVINGPNINMLGVREPEIYGHEDYNTLVRLVSEHAEKLSAEVSFFQSNHEGAIVDEIQHTYYGGFDGIIINPAAYTHTSIAIGDALKSTGLPAVEVHISDVSKREAFRQVSFVRDACIKTVMGEGLAGYNTALDALAEYFTNDGNKN